MDGVGVGFCYLCIVDFELFCLTGRLEIAVLDRTNAVHYTPSICCDEILVSSETLLSKTAQIIWVPCLPQARYASNFICH